MGLFLDWAKVGVVSGFRTTELLPWEKAGHCDGQWAGECCGHSRLGEINLTWAGRVDEGEKSLEEGRVVGRVF